jgi:hypothetical protein
MVAYIRTVISPTYSLFAVVVWNKLVEVVMLLTCIRIWAVRLGRRLS